MLPWRTRLYRAKYETADYSPGGVDHVPGDGSDGTVIQGAIASFLYDLVDVNDGSPNDNDGVSLGGDYVLDAFVDCEVLNGSDWILHTGIDHIIYCLEGGVDVSLRTLMTATPLHPLPVAERWANDAALADTAGVRRMWRRNLFGFTS